MDLSVLGIDVGKFEFHCALNIEGQVHTNHFPNSSARFERLHRWLSSRHVSRVHACMESTGGWSEEVSDGSARARSRRKHRKSPRDQKESTAISNRQKYAFEECTTPST